MWSVPARVSTVDREVRTDHCPVLVYVGRSIRSLVCCRSCVRVGRVGGQGRISTTFKFQVSALVAFWVIDLDCQTFTNIIDVFYRSPTHHCATMMQRGAEGTTPINTSTPAKR